MRILDARRGIIDDTRVFKRHTPPEMHATVSALRSMPATLTKSAPPAPAIRELPFKIDDMDEDGDFTASLDESFRDFDYTRTAQHFDDHGVVHVGGNRDEDEAVARIKSTIRNKKARRITVRGKVHDEDARRKVAQGVLSHLTFRTKKAANGGHRPVSARLSDSKHPDEAGKLTRLLKRDGSVVPVRPRGPGGDVAVGPMTKSDGSLDVFKGIHAGGPKRGFV